MYLSHYHVDSRKVRVGKHRAVTIELLCFVSQKWRGPCRTISIIKNRVLFRLQYDIVLLHVE